MFDQSWFTGLLRSSIIGLRYVLMMEWSTSLKHCKIRKYRLTSCDPSTKFSKLIFHLMCYSLASCPCYLYLHFLKFTTFHAQDIAA